MDYIGELERIAADLYPYRWFVLAGLAVALAALAGVCYVLGWHLAFWRHRVLSSAVLVVVLAVVVPTGWYLASPLFDRSFLEEASPVEAVADGADGAAGAVSDARVIRQGEWEGADDFHFGRGQALLIETAPGAYTLRVEEFSVRNGPDLFVYLSPNPGDVDGGLNLGPLKATDGAFNYEVPAGMDPSHFGYALVWCQRFSVLFATAPLNEA